MCNFNNLIQSKVHKVKKIELNAQLDHPATAYPCFLIARSDKEYHYSPPMDPHWMKCQSITRLPLIILFHQASLTIHQYSFTLLGGKRHFESKEFYPRTQHINLTGLSPGPLDRESRALNIRQKYLPLSVVQRMLI